jgi:hypothetical protein
VRSHAPVSTRAKKETERYEKDAPSLHLPVHGASHRYTCKNFYNGDKNDHSYYCPRNFVYIKNKVEQFLIILPGVNSPLRWRTFFLRPISGSALVLVICAPLCPASLRALAIFATFSTSIPKGVANRAQTLPLVQSNAPFMTASCPKPHASLDIRRSRRTNEKHSVVSVWNLKFLDKNQNMDWAGEGKVSFPEEIFPK